MFAPVLIEIIRYMTENDELFKQFFMKALTMGDNFRKIRYNCS